HYVVLLLSFFHPFLFFFVFFFLIIRLPPISTLFPYTTLFRSILEAFLWFVLITLLNVTLIILTLSVSRLLNLLLRLDTLKVKIISVDRKSGSAGMPRPISYAVFCLKKKKRVIICVSSLKTTQVIVLRY